MTTATITIGGNEGSPEHVYTLNEASLAQEVPADLIPNASFVYGNGFSSTVVWK
jgi:hypothetical protein